jgi:general secretion pathway protein F
VVEAGLRAGRLPAALESLAAFVRAYLDGRRSVGMALSYPLLVLALAYALFVMLLSVVVPRFLGAFATFRLPVPGALAVLGRLGDTLVFWGPWLPVVLLVLLVFWGWSGRSASFGPKGAWKVLRIVPWMGGVLRNYEAASFADLLGLLIENGVPYPEALALASEATGNRAIIRLGRALAETVAAGNAPAGVLRDQRVLPPLLGWLLAAGREQAALAESLHGLAAMYRKRAEYQAEKIRVFLPIVLLVAIGLTATLFFALSLFVPLTSMLRDLVVPLN